MLDQHRSPHLLDSDDESSQSLISVRRNHLWRDSLTQFSKASFEAKKPVEVIFHGEPAVDGGGPRREYFRLLCHEMKETSGLFVYHGSRHLVNFNASASLIMSQQFRLAGLMIATSIVNGGPGFPLLPMCVYRYIVDRQIDVDVDADELCADVVDVEARGVLEKVCTK